MIKNKATRMTSQRRVILEELRKVCSHPTAEEVHGLVRKKLPRISLGTVYRNLELLAGQGEILKLAAGGQSMRFDGRISAHYHARCLACGRVEDLDGMPDPPRLSAIKASEGFAIEGYNLEFVGTCARCGSGKASGAKRRKRTSSGGNGHKSCSENRRLELPNLEE